MTLTIIFFLLGVIFVVLGTHLCCNDETTGGIVMYIFALVFFGGMAAALADYIKETKCEINYDSRFHKVVQTDTTFISNNGNVDTLIHYQLTEKDFMQCQN